MVRGTGIRFKAGLKCYHINDSPYHAFNCVLMDAVSSGNNPDQFNGRVDQQTQTDLPPEVNMEEAELFGMTCDGMDIIARQIMMPKGVKVGDWLCFGGMGAYTYGPRSRFNGMRSLVSVKEWAGDTAPVTKQDELEHEKLLRQEAEALKAKPQ